jgi:CheY-like chemotaxis protein
MHKDVVILVAEDDEGHAGLIKKNLVRAGLNNTILHFKDGQETLDFLYGTGSKDHRQSGIAYLLLLDIRMPKIGGIEVLEQVKTDPELCKIPTIMITTTDDPREIEKCHALGCNNYISKPLDYDKFITAIRQLGLFLSVIQVPKINGASRS